MSRIGLGPAGYKGLLSTYIAELVTARGGGADIEELTAQLLYRHGFDALFTVDDKIDTDAVKAGLCELLPPVPVDPKQEAAERLAAAKVDNYGCGPGEEGAAKFNSLPPERRLRLLAEAGRVTSPAPSASNHYGMSSAEAFSALSPSTRLQLAHAADAARTRPKPQPRVQLPDDAASSWRPQDRNAYADCRNDEERAEMAAKARGNARADAAQREETQRQITALKK